MYPSATVKSGFIASRVALPSICRLRNLLAQPGKFGAMLNRQPFQFLDAMAALPGLR